MHSKKLMDYLPLGALLHVCNGRYGCVAGTFKPLPFAAQNLWQNLEPLQINWLKIFQNIYLRENVGK